MAQSSTLNQRLQRASEWIMRFVASDRLFYITIGILIFQAAWIALSARYPQAFDEQYHLGITQLYAKQWSPLFLNQPASADVFGALTRDPSYLYHWLLSFPYRVLTHITSNFPAQVIVLRFLNISLLAGSLVLFRKVLRFTKASPGIINTSLLFFVLVPITPLLASQINYDNMAILMTALAIWLYLKFRQQLVENKIWHWNLVGWLAISCLLGSLVKYAFLPIFVALTILVVIDWLKHRKSAITYTWPDRGRLAIVSTLALISVGLFTQMYGFNVIKYHTPTPDCGDVLSVERCQAYPPWGRNYTFSQTKPELGFSNLITYPAIWVYHVINEFTFTIGSGYNLVGTSVDYYVGTQLIVVEVISWIIFGIAVILLLFSLKRIWNNQVLRSLAIICGFYLLILFAQNFQDYISTGRPVAIHGRYILPILPIIFVMIALGIRGAIKKLEPRKIRANQWMTGLAAVFAVVLFLEGGGFVTYIYRSQQWWFWTQSPATQHINSSTQKVLDKFIIDIKPSSTD